MDNGEMEKSMEEDCIDLVMEIIMMDNLQKG